MDALQRVFEYGSRSLRTILINSEPWFVAKDVCDILEIENSRMAVSRLDDDEKDTVSLTDGTPGNPNVTVINEPGLYSLILTSRKPEARAFRRWITHDVIPAIRRTGFYNLPYSNEVLRMMDQFSRDVDLAAMGKLAQANYFKMQAALARKIPMAPAGKKPSGEKADVLLRQLLSVAIPIDHLMPSDPADLKSSVVYDETNYYIFPFAANRFLAADNAAKRSLYRHIIALGGRKITKRFRFTHLAVTHYRAYLLPRAAVEPVAGDIRNVVPFARGPRGRR